MIYIVWYMDKGEKYTPEFELFCDKDIAIGRVRNLLGKYDRIGIAQRYIEGGEEDEKGNV